MKPISVMVFVRSSEVTGISAINYYRAIGPLVYLGHEDHRFKVQIIGQAGLRHLMANGQSNQLLGADIYVISRLFAGEHGRDEFVEAIHSSGGIIVFDTDDDLTDDYRELGRGEHFKGILSAVDRVTVSTPYLASRLAEYLPYKPQVLPNYVDVDWFSAVSLQAKRQVEGLTIGFIGTASHGDDWCFAVEALCRIASEHPEVTLVTAGYVPEYLESLSNLVKLGAVPYAQYPALMRQLDVVCCALNQEDKFNLSKSSVKALEAMSAARMLPNGKMGGAVPVCTNMLVYRRTVNNRNNGLLTSNDRWYETLLELVEDEPFRTGLARRGHEWVQKNRDMKHGYRLWGDAYQKILQEVRG